MKIKSVMQSSDGLYYFSKKCSMEETTLWLTTSGALRMAAFTSI
jgi:hypothetical protein